jgi:hypothetical protein
MLFYSILLQIEKYVPESMREKSLTDVVNDPERVIVVLHPEKII